MKKKKTIREIIDVQIFRVKNLIYFYLAKHKLITTKEAYIKILIASIDMMKTMQELDVVEKQIEILKSKGLI